MSPTVEVFPGIAAVASAAAERIAGVLRRPGPSVLVLAAGKTMVPVYRELAALNARRRAPFRRATTFNLDELRVPPGDPRSFRIFMERYLFSPVNLPPERIYFLRGDTADPVGECRRFERDLYRLGPPDLALVGIGENCHVAYLEPARALPPRTSLVTLSAGTRRGLAASGISPKPREALTMGIETILSAREILLVAVGKEKAGAVADALLGRVTSRCPASLLSLHPRLTVLLDRRAASGLP